MELDEVSQLLDVSREQYDEILSIVQHHTDETVSWLGAMAAEFGWVGRAGGIGSGPESIFSITKVRGRRGLLLHVYTYSYWICGNKWFSVSHPLLLDQFNNLFSSCV